LGSHYALLLIDGFYEFGFDLFKITYRRGRWERRDLSNIIEKIIGKSKTSIGKIHV